MDDCCGTDIYWCPTAGEFQCPTHSGHDVCCDRPERHTPLARFEVQARALLKWWKEERQDGHLTDNEIRERHTWQTYQCHRCHADMRACLQAPQPCCAGCHHGGSIRHHTFSAGAGNGLTSSTEPPPTGAPGGPTPGAPNSWTEYMATVTYCPDCGGMGCDQCGGTGEALGASTPRGSSFFEQTIAAHNDEHTDP